jgi:hypothetical protein
MNKLLDTVSVLLAATVAPTVVELFTRSIQSFNLLYFQFNSIQFNQSFTYPGNSSAADTRAEKPLLVLTAARLTIRIIVVMEEVDYVLV